LLQIGSEVLEDLLHKLIVLIWQQERMPHEWSTGIISVLHKKGDTMDCNNYRGICMLNTAYKVLSRIIYTRIEPEVDRVLGEYQAGFRKNRSTADHQFSLQQIIEKCGEFNVDLHILFIDFKKAYDSIKHSAIWKALEELGCPRKLIRMIQLTLKGANAKVRCGGATSESFPVGVGLRQGDGLSVFLFNVVLEWIIRKLIRPEDMRKTALTSSFQLLAYADDIAFIARIYGPVNDNG
jgi:hypothetical protein